jgi:serine/threonine protein phosphatase PrpC
VRYVAVSALSHDGLIRDHNEDSLVIGPWTTCATTTLTPETLAFPLGSPLVIAVADGLGGHPAGDLASTIVVQHLARVGRYLPDEGSVRAAVDGCNQAVYDEAAREPARAGMGTTVAGVVLAGESVIVFNVGDSRVYVLGDDGLTRVSVDDSPPLAPGETHTVIVTQTLGGSRQERSVEAHVSTRPLDEADRYLVCSDGLSDAITDDRIATVLGESRGLEAVFELWRAAMEAGGPDNITLAVVEVVPDGGED